MPITVYGLTLQSPLHTRTTDMLTKLVYYFWASTEEFNTKGKYRTVLYYDQKENIAHSYTLWKIKHSFRL